jgi:hypothetical protein
MKEKPDNKGGKGWFRVDGSLVTFQGGEEQVERGCKFYGGGVKNIWPVRSIQVRGEKC